MANNHLILHLLKFVFSLSSFCILLFFSGSEKRQKGESFISKDPEAWMFRGGIAAEMEVGHVLR